MLAGTGDVTDPLKCEPQGEVRMHGPPGMKLVLRRLLSRQVGLLQGFAKMTHRKGGLTDPHFRLPCALEGKAVVVMQRWGTPPNS